MTTGATVSARPKIGSSGAGGQQTADVFVIFGITGDLAKVMTFRSLYRLERRGLLDCPIVGVAVDDWTVEQLAERARDSIVGTGEPLDEDVFKRLTERFSYVSGDFGDAATYERVAAAIPDAELPVFYLEIPPFLFGRVVQGLHDAGLTKNARVVVEKPFGHDGESARALAGDLHQYIDESQLYRIDHYLGKMGLEEIIHLRFANTMLEPLWSRNYLAAVEITMAEDFGVEDRGHFYDPVGALRDVVVNHLMQVVAACAMEPPSRGEPDTINDAKVALFKAVAEADPAHYVRGQYDGYLGIDGVAPDSTTETYAALRLEIENWRWSGVPFFIRTGKRLPVTQTELRLVFKHPPKLGFRMFERELEPNQLVVKLDPSPGIRLIVEAHRADAPGEAPVELDLEFADQGGEGPTPYEVLLHAALVGDSSRFTRPGRCRGDLAHHAAAARQPAARPSICTRLVGPRGRRRARRRPRPLVRALDREMTTAEPRQKMPQSAAAPSPFTPIADYAFLSNCHTGALVAPDGAVDWLCVPAFDSPSVFGSLLDREAGFFRARAVRHQPSGRPGYEPGTNVLVTTWKTPAGWIVVRDALTMGPRGRPDEITPHTRPPADDDGDHMLVRTVECIDGAVEVELVCEPAFDYGRSPAEWKLVDGSVNAADATAAGLTVRLVSDLALGIEGNRVRGRHVLAAGQKAYCALTWAEELAAPQDVDEADARMAATIRFWRSWLGRARIPDHRFRDPVQRSALAIKGLTYMPTGATVAALTTSLPETPGGERNWDYRYTWMRDTTFTLQALHWLNLDWEADEFMEFVADVEATEDGSLQIMYGIDGRRDLTESTLDHLSGYAGARPVRIGNGAFDQRQNDVFGAVLDSILLHTRKSAAAAAAAVADRRVAGRVRDEGLARAGPGHLGGARRAAALCLVEADGLGRPRPRREPGRDPRRRRAGGDVAGDGRRDPRRHPRARRLEARRPAPALRDRLARRLGAAGRDLRLPARRRRAPPRHGQGDRRGADRERLRAPLPHRRDRRRPLRQGGHVPDLLVLARLGARDRRRAAAGARPDGAAAADRLAARALRRGVRRRHRPAPRQLPAGVLPSRADGGRGADHPRRAAVLSRRSDADGRLRRDHHRHRRRRRHARPPPRAVGQADPAARARRLAAARAAELATAGRLRRQPLRLARHLVRRHGKPFQPQIHYFVGGATKLYGAALYRLRQEDFGELRHHDGISPAWPISYDDLEPYYTLAEQLYEVHGARGEDPTEPPASAPYPFPAVSHEPRIQQLSDDLDAAGYHPFHAPCGIMLDEANTRRTARASAAPPATASRASCMRKSDAEVLGVRPALEHANVTLLTNARPSSSRPNAAGTAVTEVVVERDGERGALRRPTSSSSPAARRTPPSCCSRPRTTSTRTASPTAPTRSAATTCSMPARRCSRSRARRTRPSTRRRSG